MRIVYMCVNEVLWVAPFSSTHHIYIYIIHALTEKNKKKKEIKMTHKKNGERERRKIKKVIR